MPSIYKSIQGNLDKDTIKKIKEQKEVAKQLYQEEDKLTSLIKDCVELRMGGKLSPNGIRLSKKIDRELDAANAIIEEMDTDDIFSGRNTKEQLLALDTRNIILAMTGKGVSNQKYIMLASNAKILPDPVLGNDPEYRTQYHRIICTGDFLAADGSEIKAGDRGGYLEPMFNTDVGMYGIGVNGRMAFEDNSWVADNAIFAGKFLENDSVLKDNASCVDRHVTISGSVIGGNTTVKTAGEKQDTLEINNVKIEADAEIEASGKSSISEIKIDGKGKVAIKGETVLHNTHVQVNTGKTLELDSVKATSIHNDKEGYGNEIAGEGKVTNSKLVNLGSRGVINIKDTKVLGLENEGELTAEGTEFVNMQTKGACVFQGGTHERGSAKDSTFVNSVTYAVDAEKSDISRSRATMSKLDGTVMEDSEAHFVTLAGQEKGDVYVKDTLVPQYYEGGQGTRFEQGQDLTPYQEGLEQDTSKMLDDPYNQYNNSKMLDDAYNQYDNSKMYDPYAQYEDTSKMMDPYVQFEDTSNLYDPYSQYGDTSKMMEGVVAEGAEAISYEAERMDMNR